MVRTIALYGFALAAAAFVLEWLQYRHFVRAQPTEAYVVAVAVIFAVIGAWAGRRLMPPARHEMVERNDAAIRYLGISERELDVLTLLASGNSNKEIARRLDISPNTVKTHVARLFAKLEVSRRTQAIQKARALDILPR
jgi:ATP/maltotriose-dependent transcriptional regulator MalT